MSLVRTLSEKSPTTSWRQRSGDFLPNPKAVCPTIWMEWLKDSWMIAWSSPYSLQREEQLLSPLLAWTIGHHQEAHMNAKGIIWRFWCCKPWKLSPYWWTLQPHGTWKQNANTITGTNTLCKEMVGRSTLGRNSPVEDPWHSWHMPYRESGTEVVTVAKLCRKQNPYCVP